MRVMLVEGQEIVRAGLKTLLEMDSRVQVTATESSARKALAKLELMAVDVLFVDASLPGADGIWLTQQVSSRFPQLPVIILTTHVSKATVTAALDAGARAYLSKEATKDELVQALNAIKKGVSYIQPRIASIVLSALRTRASDTSVSAGRLSDRELEVLQLASLGLRNQEIADRLHLSLSTVKTHFRALYRKLEVGDRTQAILVGLNHRIIKSPLCAS